MGVRVSIRSNKHIFLLWNRALFNLSIWSGFISPDLSPFKKWHAGQSTFKLSSWQFILFPSIWSVWFGLNLVPSLPQSSHLLPIFFLYALEIAVQFFGYKLLFLMTFSVYIILHSWNMSSPLLWWDWNMREKQVINDREKVDTTLQKDHVINYSKMWGGGLTSGEVVVCGIPKN